MPDIVAPIAFTLAAWWIGTGLILYLDGLPRRTFKWQMLGASLVGIAGLGGIAASAGHTTVASAYCGFACAILVWAWQELAFLLGIATGPRRAACPPDARGWRRAGFALQTVWHHELMLLALGAAVAAVTWGQPNTTGWWTYLILWAMRQSAKLNVFLGVRNLAEGFLPAHLAYLQSYFTRKPMNALLPLSVAAATAVVVPIWQSSLSSSADPFTTTASTLLAGLLTLAIAEHVFLVMPLPLDGLFRWGLRSRVGGR